jgi:hypothetical protein
LFDRAELTAAHVYPDVWDEEADELLSYLEYQYDRIVAVFRAAAWAGEPVLIWMN